MATRAAGLTALICRPMRSPGLTTLISASRARKKLSLIIAPRLPASGRVLGQAMASASP
jgi:hypothetical protein